MVTIDGVSCIEWLEGGACHLRGLQLASVFLGTCGLNPSSFGVPFTHNMDVNPHAGDGTFCRTFSHVVDGVEFIWKGEVGRFDEYCWGRLDGDAAVVITAFVAQGTEDFEGT